MTINGVDIGLDTDVFLSEIEGRKAIAFARDGGEVVLLVMPSENGDGFEVRVAEGEDMGIIIKGNDRIDIT